MIFKRMFNEKLKASEILLDKGREVNIHGSLFPKHQDRGKGHVMASHSEAKVKRMIPEGELRQALFNLLKEFKDVFSGPMPKCLE